MSTIILLLAVLLGTLVLLGATVISYQRDGKKFELKKHLLFFLLSFVVIGTTMVFSDQIAVRALIGFLLALGGGWAVLKIIKIAKVSDFQYPVQGLVSNMNQHSISLAKAIALFISSFGGVILLWASETPALDDYQYLVVTIAVLLIVTFLFLCWRWTRSKQ